MESKEDGTAALKRIFANGLSGNEFNFWLSINFTLGRHQTFGLIQSLLLCRKMDL
jgi:hypothetical protein